MNAFELKAQFESKGENCWHPSALVRFIDGHYNPLGIVVLISENLGGFCAGSLICFWSDGDITTLDTENDVDLIRWIMPVEEGANDKSA